MDDRRCHRCRQPLHDTAVLRPLGEEERWFHPGCWDESCAIVQREYEREVEALGLAALLAPYVERAPAGPPRCRAVV